MTRRLPRRVSRPLAIGVALLALVGAAGIVLAVSTPDPTTAELNEDATSVAIPLTASTDNLVATTATIGISTAPTHGSIDEGSSASMTCLTGSCSGTVHYTPTADYFGSDSFQFTVDDGDGSGASAPASVTITVDAVNDPPTFSNNGGVEVNEDSGAYSATWATSIDAGPNEGSQTVTFSVTGNDNPTLFSVAPAVASDGTLTFTPAADANGVATMTVTAQDNGGTSNGGDDTSSGATLTITVDAVNDPPTFTQGPDEVVNHDSGAFTASSWATNISPGPDDETSQTVSFSFTADDNASLFSVLPAVASNGDLTFTVAAGHTGTAHLTLEAMDDGGTANGGDATTDVPVVIRVNANPNAVNDNATVGENAVAAVVDVLANDTSLPDPPEVLTVASVSNDNVNGPLHGTAAVSGTNDSVTYTPTAGYYGSDFFRYTITDPYGGTDFATVFVTITKDTTPPTTSLPVEGISFVKTMTSTALTGVMTWTGADAGVGIAHFDLQRSVDGGAFTTLTLPTPTSTSLPVGFGLGHHYQFRVRAVDQNGNIGAWMTGPSFVQARYQETSGYIKYSTGWTLTSNTSDSGGGAKYAGLINKYASFTHVVRDVAIVGPRSSTRGSFDIYVDGVKVGAAAMKTTTTKYQQVVWSLHFSKIGTHTIKIVLRGNGRVDLDCFVILT